MIWLFIIVFPLLLALLLGFAATRDIVSRHGLWLAPLPALVPALAGGGLEPGYFPSLFLETTLHFGPYGRIFLLLTALLWTAAGIYAGSKISSVQSDARFALFFLFTLSGNLGLTVAQDLASFYVFFALMSFAAYGLIIHDGSAKALRAGRVYLIMAVFGEVLLAAAFFYAGLAGQGMLFVDIAPVLPGHADGPLVLVLAFAGFGIKAGVLGLHVWLPLAHPAAPVPASAVLSGTMIKAGLLGWLQLFGLQGNMAGWDMTLCWLGLAAAVYGVAHGLGSRDPKTILAYSSVSQMGLMTMAFGFALGSGGHGAEQVLSGLLLFVLVHGLAKGALFLGAGVAKCTERDSQGGLLVLAGLAFAGLVLAGLPFTGGAVVKHAMKEGAGLLSETWSGFFSGMLSLTAAGTMLLLAVFIRRVREAMALDGKTAGTGMISAWLGLLILLLVVVPLTGTVLPEQQEFFWRGLVPADWKTAFAGFWPVGLGLLGACLFTIIDRKNNDRKGPDDLLLAGLERLLARTRHWWQVSPLCDPACGRIDLVAWSDRLLQSRWMRTVPDRIEQHLLYWHTVGVLFIALLLGFVFLARPG